MGELSLSAHGRRLIALLSPRYINNLTDKQEEQLRLLRAAIGEFPHFAIHVYRLRTCNTKRRHAETLSCFFWPAAAEEIDLLEHGVRRAGEDEASLARQFTKTPRNNSSASAHLLTPCPTPWLDLHAPANAPRSEIQGQACHHAHQVSESPPATPDIMLRQCWGVTASRYLSL